MKRRGFLGVFAAAAAAGVSAVPGPAPLATGVEPRPRQFNFEPCGSCDADCALSTVSTALGVLEWDSADPVKPLLVVNSASYGWALEIVLELNNKIALWATPSLDRDAWFVTWRGRRAGSVGA
jgi:hypothetical protein